MKPLHELDALCAEKVAGWGDVMPAGYVDPESGTTYYTPTGGTFHNPFRRQIPSYTTDPAAVLGLLEKEWYWVSDNGAVKWGGGHIYHIRVGRLTVKGEGVADHEYFCIAAVLALLRAHGVETE